jgi:hypothetical protein
MQLAGRLRITVFATILIAAPARADSVAEAKAHWTKGLGAYALGDYPQAAAEYEKAFALHTDPALLYNAAQAHRLAGNKQRALLLYQNYLRLFGGPRMPYHDEVVRHIGELKVAIESEQRATTSPPTEPALVDKSEPKPTTKTATASAQPTPQHEPAHEPAHESDRAPTGPSSDARREPAATAPLVVATTPAKPAPRRPWIWGVVAGAAAVVGVGIGLGVGLTRTPPNPTPTFGVAAVQ